MNHITPWNFSHAKVELQLTLKQISLALSHEETKARAEAELKAFTTSFLERQLDVQETDLVADILRGINGKVAEQVLRLLNYLGSRLNLAHLVFEWGPETFSATSRGLHILGIFLY